MKWIKTTNEDSMPKDKYILFWRPSCEWHEIMKWDPIFNAFRKFVSGKLEEVMCFKSWICKEYSHYSVLEDPMDGDGWLKVNTKYQIPKNKYILMWDISNHYYQIINWDPNHNHFAKHLDGEIMFFESVIKKRYSHYLVLDDLGGNN